MRFLTAGSIFGVSVNPIIYATGYEVFRNYLKQKFCVSEVAPARGNVP